MQIQKHIDRASKHVESTRLQTQPKAQATAVSLALPSISVVLMSLIFLAARQAPHDFPLPSSLCVCSSVSTLAEVGLK